MNEVFEEIRAAWFSVVQRRWLALAVAWGVSILGWLMVAMIPNSYQSEARIYVQLDDVLAEQLKIAGGSARGIARIRQTLASSVNLQKVVRSTRLGDNVNTRRDMEIAIEDLYDNVTILSETDNLFELKAEIGMSSLSDAENALLAQSVVQKLIDIFREENLAGDRGDVAETIVFLDQQLEERKLALEEAEQRRLAFEANNPDLIGGASTLSLRIQNLRQDIRDVDSDLAAAESTLAAINSQLLNTPRNIAGRQGSSHKESLEIAKGQMAVLQSRGLTASHPDFVALERHIALLSLKVANETPADMVATNPAYSSLLAIKGERQANVQALSSRKAGLNSELSSLLASQSSEPAAAAEANRISRDYEVLKDNYDQLLQDREELKLRGQVENDRSSFKFEVIDPPTTPRSPFAPNRPLLLVGVLFAGLAVGAGVAFLSGQLRSTFATAQKLEEATGLTVVCAISQTMTDSFKRQSDKQMRYFSAASASLGVLCIVLLILEFFQRGMVA